MRIFAAALACGLLALAAPSLARAQVSPPELFRSAERAFADADYLEALRLFRAANEAAPHPTVRFHIAMCLERLGRGREAWTELTEVAATPGLTDAQREDAQRRAEQLRAQLATLRVEGEPEGASVRVDDALMCNLPCEVPVDPGDHEVSIEDGSGRASTHVVALRGTAVAVRLAIGAEPEPEPAPELAVDAEPTPEPAARRAGVGWLTITGSVVAALGAGGVIGFGLHAEDVHGAWLESPSRALYDEGTLSRDLSNASIAVFGVGAVLIVIDLALAAAGEGTGERASLDPVVRF